MSKDRDRLGLQLGPVKNGILTCQDLATSDRALDDFAPVDGVMTLDIMPVCGGSYRPPTGRAEFGPGLSP